MLYQMLLYDRENEQYKSYKRMRPIMPVIDCIRMLPRYKVAKQAEQNVPKTGASKFARPMQDGMPSGTSSKHHCNTNAQSSMPPSTANLPFRIPPRPQSPTITNIRFIMPPIPQPPTSASIPFTMPPLPKLPTVNLPFPTPPRPQASTSANVSTTIPLRPQTSTAANAPQASTSTHNAPPNLQPQASTSSANAPTNMPPQVSKSRVDAPKKIPQHESTSTKNPPPDLTSTENVIPKILEASLPNANTPVQVTTTSAAVQESSPIREPTSIAEVQESCPVQEPTASVAVQESSPEEEPAQVPTANAPVQGSTANTALKMAPEASTSTENASPKLLPQPQASTSTHNAPLKMPLLEPSISTTKTPPAMLPLPSPSPASNPSSIMPPPPPKPSTFAVIPSSTMQPKPSTSSAKHTCTLPPPRPSTSTAKHTYRMPQPKPSTSTAKHTYSRPPPPSMPSTSRVPPNFQIPNEVETISILPPNITNAQTDPQVVWTRKAEQYAKDLSSWRILPAECYAQGQPDPSMVYGLFHLLRLFVKLPDILNRTLIPRRKVRIIAHHVNMMSEHIQDTYAFPVHRLYVRVPRSKTYKEDQIGFGSVTSEEEKHPNRNVQKETDLSQYHTRSYRTEVPDRAVPMLPKVVQVPLSSTSNAVEEHKLTVSNHCMEDIVEICVENQVMETSEAPNPEANENNDVVMTEPIDQGSVTVLVPTVNDEAKDKNEELTKTSIKIETNVSHQTKRKLEVKAQREPTPPFEPMVRKVRKSAADAAFKTAHIFNSIPMAPRVVIPCREVVKTESRSTPVVKKRARSGGSPSRNPDPKRIMRISEREKEEKSSKVVVKTENTGSVNQESWGRNSRQTHRSSITTEKNVSRSPQRGINRGTATPVIKLEKLQKEDQNPGTSGTKNSSTQKDETDKRPTTDNSRRVSPSSSSRCNQSGDRKLFSPKKMQSVPKPNPSPRTSKSNSTHRESGSPCKSPQKSGAPPSTTLRLRSRSDERQLRSKGQHINALSLPTIAPRSSLGPKSKDRSPTRRESSGHRESCSSSSNTISVKREDSSPALRRRKR